VEFKLFMGVVLGGGFGGRWNWAVRYGRAWVRV